jgi:hypothetical protein
MTWSRPTRSRTERGYGLEHQQLRQRWAPIVAAGTVRCPRCGRDIHAGQAWDLGHDDQDRSLYTGPEHALCNRRAGARAGNRVASRNRRRRREALVTSRAW